MVDQYQWLAATLDNTSRPPAVGNLSSAGVRRDVMEVAHTLSLPCVATHCVLAVEKVNNVN